MPDRPLFGPPSYCRTCGHRLPKSWAAFCPSCGHALDVDAESTSESKYEYKPFETYWSFCVYCGGRYIDESWRHERESDFPIFPSTPAVDRLILIG